MHVCKYHITKEYTMLHSTFASVMQHHHLLLAQAGAGAKDIKEGRNF